MDENRIDELAQTKVEASQKFPIRITGMALFNASVNGRFNGNAENPLVASPTPGEMTGDGTLRQSTLGLLFNGPADLLEWQRSADPIYMDFFGGSTSSLDHLVRLRTAAINIDWKNTSVMFGQDKPIISPRDPDSLAQVGYSPLTGAGNLWLWQPQARVEQRFSLGENSGLRAQAGVIVTSSLDYPSNAATSIPAPELTQQEYSRPGAEGRLELWHRWSDTGPRRDRRRLSLQPKPRHRNPRPFGDLFVRLVPAADFEAGVFGNVFPWPECRHAGRAAARVHCADLRRPK